VPLNLNVLDANCVPRVMNLKEVLRAFLDHRRVVLLRRTRNRLVAIDRRIEILNGQIVVYLNIDEVIRIIRESDHPKARLIERWDLSEVQAEAILNIRLRALAKLEEIEIRKELATLETERGKLATLLDQEKRQWKAIAAEIRETDKEFGDATKLGRRRTDIGTPPVPMLVPVEAMIEREPVTVVCSEKGWIRSIKGHAVAAGDIKYKDGDGPRFVIQVETTDKLAVFGSNGRFYTLPVDRLPGGRGHGEPLRLMIELANEHDVVTLFPYRAEHRLLVVASDGRGFVTGAEETLAQTRSGKQVLVPGAGAQASICLSVTGDTVALVGDNRKLLIYPVKEIPEMTRGRGVMLQKFKDGGLADAKVFNLADGLSWRQGETRTRTETDLTPWQGARASSGRIVPPGFPKNNRFG
jgi:topoisomerase IV subunit A